MGLSRLNRLTRADNFVEIKRRGKKFSSGGLTFYINSNQRDVSRLAVTLSSKLADACKRNRVKRLFHEVFRLNSGQFCQNVDIIVTIQKEVVPLVDYPYIKEHFLSTMKMINLL